MLHIVKNKIKKNHENWFKKQKVIQSQKYQMSGIGNDKPFIIF